MKKDEQNLAWSEEDEDRLQSCLNILQAKGIRGVTETINTKWLKSLKERVQQPRQEWSEEDENILEAITYTVKNSGYSHCIGVSNETMIEWLKSLKERVQSQWKPSEEQMDALQYVCRNLNPPLSDKLGWNSLKTLELMFEQLKKLKE